MINTIKSVLDWLDRPQPLFLFALLVFLYVGTAGASQQAAVEQIQRDGHYFYLPDQRARHCFYGGDCDVKDVYRVLPKDWPANCSHWAAKKIELIRSSGIIAFPLVAEYDKTVNGYIYRHAVVIVPKINESGYWLLDNDTWRLKSVDNLDWMPNRRIGTLEQMRETYNQPLQSK